MRNTWRAQRWKSHLGRGAHPGWPRAMGRQRPLLGAKPGRVEAAGVCRSQFVRAEGRSKYGRDSEVSPKSKVQSPKSTSRAKDKLRFLTADCADYTDRALRPKDLFHYFQAVEPRVDCRC